MPRDTLTGSRIRERRVMAGLRQADLARQAEISPSYLNLIEHNRRRIGGKLLNRLAAILGVEPNLLTQGAEATLIASLREAALGHPQSGPELARVDEFAGRFPGWAGLLAQQRTRIDGLERIVATLTDRLAHDPQLAASLHEVLSTATAIRSTAAILAEPGEIEPEWSDRFHRNINEDAARLADSSRALARYLESAGDASADVAMPQEEVDAFFEARGYHLPGLEQGSEDAQGPAAMIAANPALTSAAAQDVALRHLDRYRADAQALPLAPVRAFVATHGVDPLALAAAFNVDVARAMRRLASLPNSEATGLVVCDGAGMLTLRKPVRGFALPRFGAACPLWPLFSALNRPMVPISMLIRQPGRDAAVLRALAIAQPVSAPCPGRDPLYEAHMLITPAPGETDALAVGTTCRVCPRTDCEGRREPSILSDGF